MTADYTGFVIPNEYNAYAHSETEAQEIVKAVEAANFKGAAIYRELPYVPGLWSIALVAKGIANAE